MRVVVIGSVLVGQSSKSAKTTSHCALQSPVVRKHHSLKPPARVSLPFSVPLSLPLSPVAGAVLRRSDHDDSDVLLHRQVSQSVLHGVVDAVGGDDGGGGGGRGGEVYGGEDREEGGCHVAEAERAGGGEEDGGGKREGLEEGKPRERKKKEKEERG